MISKFDGKYGFLSNFCEIDLFEIDGIFYNTVEAAYQAAKTHNTFDKLAISSFGPVQAKRYGRKVQMRPDWDEIKLQVMESLLRIKFKQPDLQYKLLMTGDLELVEGNWWHDTFWGVCNGTGENHLGKLLMKIRTELQQQPKTLL